MGPLPRIATGIALMLLGALVALNYTGVYFIADCGPGCVERGERLVVVLLILAGIGIAGAGGWVLRGGIRARRAMS